MYTRNIQARSHNHFYRKRAISITYADCVSAATIIIYHTRLIPAIELPSVASGSSIFFPHYLINGTIFGKN